MIKMLKLLGGLTCMGEDTGWRNQKIAKSESISKK
jgi:hypothetical protein